MQKHRLFSSLPDMHHLYTYIFIGVIALLFGSTLYFANTIAQIPVDPLPARARQPEKPNVIFITTDDMAYFTSYTKSYPGVSTPNIDRLASRGVFFTNAHASGSSGNISRSSYMTGLKPLSTKIMANEGYRFRDSQPETITLQDYFSQHGYKTFGAGKVFHSDHLEETWDDYIKEKEARPSKSDFPLHGYQELVDLHSGLDWGPLDLPDEDFTDGASAAFAVEKLQQTHSDPFFLAVGFVRPHFPQYVPQRFYDQFFDDPKNPSVTLPADLEGDELDLPRIGQRLYEDETHPIYQSLEAQDELIAAYLASIAFMDDQVGTILDALDTSPYANNTIIVFTSDHGHHQGEKRRYKKGTSWNIATQVPMIIAAPGITTPGTTNDDAISTLDLYPTLVRLAGLPHRTELDGLDLTPLLKTPEMEHWYGRTAVNHKKLSTSLAQSIPGIANTASIQWKQWKYILYGDGGEELYDSFSDWNNFNNLADDPSLQETKTQLKRMLQNQLLPNKPPVRISDTSLYGPILTLKGYDRNEDVILFEITQEPIYGTLTSNGLPLSQDYPRLNNITDTEAQVTYTPLTTTSVNATDTFAYRISDGRYTETIQQMIINNHIYFYDASDQTIYLYNLDTKSVTPVITTIPHVSQLAIHAKKNALYWLSQGSIYTTGLGNNTITGASPTIQRLITTEQDVHAFTIHNNTIYWAEWTETQLTSGRIMKSNMRGDTMQLVTQVSGRPRDFTIHNGYLYWADPVSSDIQRIHLQTDEQEIVVTNAEDVVDIAIVDDTLYWVHGSDKTIYRLELTEYAQSASHASTIATDISNPWQTDLLARGDKVIWSQRSDNQSSPGTLNRYDTQTNTSTVLAQGHRFIALATIDQQEIDAVIPELPEIVSDTNHFTFSYSSQDVTNEKSIYTPIAIYNSGTSDLTINGYRTVGDTALQIDTARSCTGRIPFTLAPSEGCNILLELQSAEITSNSNTLIIDSNDPNTPELAITINSSNK